MVTGISSVQHYENFPVASRLVPARLRPAITAVYWFARTADDLADEGDARPEERLQALHNYQQALARYDANPSDIFAAPALPLEVKTGFEQLFRVIREYHLSLAPFQDLLSAFEQDAAFRALPGDAQLLNYCSRSANPVGRIVLALFDCSNETLLPAADAVCTSLQLINFLQDMRPDAQRGRLYIPLDRLHQAGFDQVEWLRVLAQAPPQAPSPQWLSQAQQLIRTEHDRAQRLLREGSILPDLLRQASSTSENPRDLKRLALELRATIAGGQCILDKIARNNFNPCAQRPHLVARDWLKVALTTLFSRA